MEKFDNVTVQTLANIYFDGKVISHSIYATDGSKKTLGIIYPGTYKFNTDVAEQMDITQGNCKIKISGENSWKAIEANQSFAVPAKSCFEIEVENEICQYICSFIK